MKSFIEWAKENKLELPIIDQVSEPATSENTKRTGYSANYPAQYVSGQYPHHYFNPIKATADLDAQIMKKK